MHLVGSTPRLKPRDQIRSPHHSLPVLHGFFHGTALYTATIRNLKKTASKGIQYNLLLKCELPLTSISFGNQQMSSITVFPSKTKNNQESLLESLQYLGVPQHTVWKLWFKTISSSHIHPPKFKSLKNSHVTSFRKPFLITQMQVISTFRIWISARCQTNWSLASILSFDLRNRILNFGWAKI